MIYKVKTAFNSEFDGVRKQKEQEMGRVREKNRRMGEIMGELGAQQELWEPTMGDSEQPERALTVEDSEVGHPSTGAPEILHHGDSVSLEALLGRETTCET